jgi:guanine deaminase
MEIETVNSLLPPQVLRPPFALRATLATPLTSGGFFFEKDAIIVIDSQGKISWVGPSKDYLEASAAVDLRPLLVTPGMVDVHSHLPQLPLTGFRTDYEIVEWLEKVMSPVERAFDGEKSRSCALEYLSLIAAAGTTTQLSYGSVDRDATDYAFATAATHGFRIILGQCLMDKMRYDNTIPDAVVTAQRLAESDELCSRWHNHDEGRLLYAFTPRFAPSCSREMMKESAKLASQHGAYWQTHLSETPEEMGVIREMYPEARDYLDVYDRAGGLGPNSIFAHCVFLSDAEINRMVETGSVVAHCPSNVFGSAGIMDLARYLKAGLRIGIGTDVSTSSSCFHAIEVGWLCQKVRQKLNDRALVMLEQKRWFELATLGGARALGLESRIGSLEMGKDADMILIDLESLRFTGALEIQDLTQALGLLIHRTSHSMVQATWVRGKSLPRPIPSPNRLKVYA